MDPVGPPLNRPESNPTTVQSATQLPAQPSVVPPAEPVHATSSGLIIMQWLTYAFWGWTVLALSVLTGAVLANFIDQADTGGFTPYAVAAVLVLLPISLICDVLYSKREPQKKVGGAMIIMVIHAVLFALIGIGSLIVAVFSIVSLTTSSTDHSATLVSLYTALIITVFYAVTFLRTLNPGGLRWIRWAYMGFMLVFVGLFIVLGLAGPVANARVTKDDRLIESDLPDITTAITAYATQSNRLPDSLSAISLDSEPKQLIDRGLVTYTPNSLPQGFSDATPASIATTTATTYYYTLCVTYKKASPGGSVSLNSSTNGYTDYIDTTPHPAGLVCYKVSTPS